MITAGKGRNLEEIKKWLLKHEFTERQSTPGVFIKNTIPNQRMVDLTKEEPEVCVFDGKERWEWDAGHGLLEMPDIYNSVMMLWNTKYKQQESEEKEPVKLPYACHDCEAGITAEQRAASFKAQGMALCTDCESKHQNANANDKTPGEKSDTITPPPPMSSSGEQSSSPTITHEEISDDVAIAGAIQHIIIEGVKTNEQIGKVVLYWCGGDKNRAGRLISQVIAGITLEQAKKKKESEKEKPKGKEKEKPKEKPKETEVIEPAKEKPGEPPKVEKPGENLPIEQKGQLPGKPMSDAERDREIERAKARRFLQTQGDSYSVSGKERPDAAGIQYVANEEGVCVEIIEAVQTDDYSQVIVRGHYKNQYLDDVVHHDFKTEFLLKTMEIIQNNPEILDHYEGTNPVIKAGAKMKKVGRRGEIELVDAQYYLVHALLSFKKFSLRDACTKSTARVQAKLLNREFMDEEEKASEQAEKDLVEKSKRR